MSGPDTDRETAEDQALMESVNQTPIVRTLDSLIFQAVRDRASDVHIQPQPTHTSVRYRIDGILQQVLSLPLSTHRSIIARLRETNFPGSRRMFAGISIAINTPATVG